MHVHAPKLRPALIDIIARTEAEPGSDEAHFLRQLRAAIADIEVLPLPLGRRSPDPLGRLMARYPD